MGLIDINKILIVKIEQLNKFLLDIESSLTNLDPLYPLTLILANIFAYFFILLFLFCVFLILKNINRKIRNVFN